MAIESTKQDIAASLIEDFIPERLIRVYPYEFIDAGPSDAFIQDTTVSIATISQGNLDTTDELLLVDDNGHKYFEMLASINSEGKLDISAATSVFGQELKEESTFTCLSNWYYEGELSNIKVGSSRLLPAVFIIGEPFDFDKYKNGEQAAFIPSSVVEAKEGTAQFHQNELDTAGLYEFTLINITNIEASFTNSRILLHTDRIDRTDLRSFEIVATPQILIDKVKVKGTALDKYGTEIDATDVDFQTTSKAAKLKVVPISTQDKLTVFFDCFDANIHLPKDIAEVALKEISLTDFAKKVGMSLELVDLITDMLLYTTQFSKRFGQVPRNDDGKIDKEWKIGTENDFLSGITNQDVNTVVDGLYRNWRTKFPNLVDTGSEKIFKQFIAAMSDSFAGELAIGKGQSSFHQNYLLWYFQLTSPVNANVDTGKKTVTLNAHDIKFKLASKYYNIGSKSLEPKGDTDLSEIGLIESDRKISLPELPDTISPVNKLSLPGDVDTKTSTDLMYFMNLFLSTSEISKFYGNVSTPTTGYSKARWDNQQLPVQIAHYTARTADDKIQSLIRSAYPDARNIKIITTGVSQSVDDQSKYLVREEGLNAEKQNTATNANQKDRGLEKLLYDKHTVATQGGVVWYNSLDKNGLTDVIADYYHTDKSNVKILSFSKTNSSRTLSFSFYLIHYTWIKYEYEFETKQRIARLSEKATTYDKARFRELIKSAYDPRTNWERPITLTEKYGAEYFKLKEIIISSIFGDNITLTFRDFSIEVPLFNKDDETIGVQRILFT